MPTVRFVTPGDVHDKHLSLDAFEDELLHRLGWEQKGIDYNVLWAENNNKHLRVNAQAAVDEAKRAVDGAAVIVASGSMAAEILQRMTKTIPIIQGAGGRIPANKKNNLTGFHIDALYTAQYHLDHLPTKTVTILWDDTNEPSKEVRKKLKPKGKNLNFQQISDPAKLPDLDIDKTGGFMLLPNAMYYNHCEVIRDVVEASGVDAFYPEREYLGYTHPIKKKVRVHGHHIPITYRHAARYVDSIVRKILGKSFKVKDLPDFEEAPKDVV
jgi:hypothetical protein